MSYVHASPFGRFSLALYPCDSPSLLVSSDTAKKAEQNCMRLLNAAKDGLAKEKDPVKPSGMLAKFQSSIAKAAGRTGSDFQQKAHVAAVAYQDALAAANVRQHKYMTVDLPSIFKGMQSIETGRLDFLKVHLSRYATLLRDSTTPMKVWAETNLLLASTVEDLE